MPEELILEKSLVVLGDEDVVMGFRSLGFEVYALKGNEDLKVIIEEITQKKIAVCLLQDKIYSQAQEVIDSYKNLSWPVFLPFTKTLKNTLLDNTVRNIRLRATGTF